MLEQPNLPNFDRAEAEARERNINLLLTIGRLAKFYVNMDKCKDPKIVPLCRRQKKALKYYFTAEYIRTKERG